MEQENIELKVWKDLAVSKQILMRTASDALGLAPDCNADELKVALDAAITKGSNAETAIKEAQEQAKDQVAEMDRQLKETKKALADAVGKNDAAEQGQKDAEHRVTAAREANAKELKKLTEQVAEKQRAIKTIHTALADTPENVVKKLKKLKKEKLDEANACKRAESEVRTLKKEKKKLEESLEEAKSKIEKCEKLAEEYRALHDFSEKQHSQLEGLVDDRSNLEEVPTLDERLLENIESHGKDKEQKNKAA